MVQFVNATPTSATLYFGDNSEFTDVAQGKITTYKQIAAERRDFKLQTSEAAGEPLATNSEGLSAGKHYTVLAVEKSRAKPVKYDLTVFDDDLAPSIAPKFSIRVFRRRAVSSRWMMGDCPRCSQRLRTAAKKGRYELFKTTAHFGALRQDRATCGLAQTRFRAHKAANAGRLVTNHPPPKSTQRGLQ